MKIVYTIAGTYRPAGMERILTDKANYLAGVGNEILIVTTEQKGRPDIFELNPSIRRKDLGIGYEENNGESIWSKFTGYLLKQRRHRALLTSLLMEEKADIVISMFCGDETFLPKIKDGSKKLLEVHFSKFKRLQYGRRGLWRLADMYRSWREKAIVSRFDAFVTLTREDFQYWGSPKNGHIISNFISKQPESPSPLTSHTVLSVGRLTYQKGFDRLLRIWKRVVRMLSSDNDWVLRIVGSGEEANRLKRYALRLGLQNKVIFSPVETNMDAVYCNSSLFVLTSRYEGLPMVLLEAQSYGLPIVSYNCKCGPADVIHDSEDGFLIEEGDEISMSYAILDLICNNAMRESMGIKGFENSEKWGKEPVMNQWVELFEKLLSYRQ